MRDVAELSDAQRVDHTIVAEDVHTDVVLRLEAMMFYECHRVCDAEHVQLALEADVVGDAVRVVAIVDVVDAGQNRPGETLVVGVLHVDNRLPSDELSGVGMFVEPYRGWYVRTWTATSRTASRVQ